MYGDSNLARVYRVRKEYMMIKFTAACCKMHENGEIITKVYAAGKKIKSISSRYGEDVNFRNAFAPPEKCIVVVAPRRKARR